MDKYFVPIIVQSPWPGEYNAQRGVASALARDSLTHIMIPDPFWRTDLERQFKAAKGNITLRKKAWKTSLDEAREIVLPLCRTIDEERAVPVIINMGGRDSAAFLALSAKNELRHSAFLVNILYPKLAEAFYDLLALPPVEKKRAAEAATLQVGSVPNMVMQSKLDEAKTIWAPILKPKDIKTVGVLVGGYVGVAGVGDGVHSFSREHGEEFVKQILQIREQTNCALLLTTSRRTPEDVVRLLQEKLGPLCAHTYFPPQEHPNPFMGYMACADAFVVTADSMSMLSEAADTGKPVYAYYPRGILSSEHERLYAALQEGGHVTELPAAIEFGPGRPIRAAESVAHTVIDMVRSGQRAKRPIHEIMSSEFVP